MALGIGGIPLHFGDSPAYKEQNNKTGDSSLFQDDAEEVKCDEECYKDDDAACRKGICLCAHSLTERQGPCTAPATPGYDFSAAAIENDIMRKLSKHHDKTVKNDTDTVIDQKVAEKVHTMPLVENDFQQLNHGLLVMEIILPIIGLLLLTLITLLLMKKRRVGIFRERSKSQASEWIRRNDNSMSLLDSMSLVNKNPTYYSPHTESANTKYHDKEIAQEALTLLEEIGEGAFGQVFKGELEREDESRTVAVKLLKNGVSREIKEDFEREVEICSTFDHDNILKLIGVVTKDVNDSPYMVFEYMEHGDLAGLLRRNDPNLRRNRDRLHLKDTHLVDIAIQVASGMVYLTNQHFVHRDLATRNCLVGASYIVKISDFGMSRDIYTCDYYKIGGSRMLPVRWMSPESVKYGRFTSESDVWSYGVVLWEIFSWGKQPYYGHTNEEVVAYVENSQTLVKPETCPPEVFDVMTSCWRTEAADRCTFDEAHKRLVDYSKIFSLNYHRRHALRVHEARILQLV